VHQRVAIAEALAGGRTALETEPDGAAARKDGSDRKTPLVWLVWVGHSVAVVGKRPLISPRAGAYRK
jgi:hypothetical protein